MNLKKINSNGSLFRQTLSTASDRALEFYIYGKCWIESVPNKNTNFASTQVVWHFYKNDKVTGGIFTYIDGRAVTLPSYF